MLKYFKDQIKCYQCRIALRKKTQPSDEFLNQCRQLFLDKICPAPFENAVPHRNFSLIYRYALYSFFGVVLLLSGTVVFADMSNVSYNHPLYQLKLFGESVRLKLVSGAGESYLHEEFAQRRFEEMKKMADNNVVSAAGEKINVAQSVAPASDEVVKLNKQMHQELNFVLNDVAGNKIEGERIKIICQEISRMLIEDEQIFPEIKSDFRLKNNDILLKNCADFLDR